MAASKHWPRPVIRPATAADLKKFYGKPPAQTMTARVGLVRGKIVGCGGVAYIDGRVIAFCDFKPSARKYKVSIVKAALQIIGEVRARGCRVMYADIDPNEMGAVRWVTSMGFKPTLKSRLYRWQA